MMWIRSQDKLRLANCSGVYIDYNRRTEISGSIGSYDSDDDYFLGKYESEQRALEVLDEIQQFAVDAIRCKDDKMFYPIFDMPEE